MAKKSSVEASKKNAHEKNELLQQERKKNLLLRFLAVSYTHLRAHETVLDIVCRLLLEKKIKTHMITF